MSKNLELQELAIALTAKNLTPTLLNPEFLKYGDIIPADWQLARKPIYNQRLVQLVFQNGVMIVAQPNRVFFAEAMGTKKLPELQIPAIARKYIDKLPSAEYQGVGINPRGHVIFPEADGAYKYLVTNLLSPGAWQDFGTGNVKPSVNLAYPLQRGQLNLSLNEATLKLPEDKSVPALLFSGNFNYEIVGETPQQRLQDLRQLIGNWSQSLKTYQQLVNQKFLQQAVKPANGSQPTPEAKPVETAAKA